MRPTATLAAAVIAAGGALVSAQIGRPQTTFRSEINYVEIDVVVTDADGRFAPGLTASDFAVRDEGRPQSIDVFQEVNVPVVRSDRPRVPVVPLIRDVVSNVETADGRVYLLLLDDLHTASSNTNEVKRRAREFVEGYVGQNDLAAVVYASGRGAGTQDFTSDRARLLAAIDKFSGRGLRSAVLNRIDDFNERTGTAQEGRPVRDRDARQRLMAARGTLRALRDVSAALASMTGRRKALLFFSEGIDLDSDSSGSADAAVSKFSDAQEARTALQEAIAGATRANVHVYAIDASRMSSGSVGADVAALTRGDRAIQAARDGLNTEAIASERRRALGTLRTIAEQTGGIAIVDTTGLADGYARIQRENSTYYVLGFYPTSDRDGKFHRLDVRVNRPGLQVRSRAGFHAAPPAASVTPPTAGDVMSGMLNAALPSAGLPLRASLPVFRKTRSEATVLMAVDVPPGVLRFDADGATFAEDFHIVYQVIEPPSKVVTTASKDLEMRLRPDVRAVVDARGFRAVFPITVKPGRYQVRIAARAKNGGRHGSVFADLVVPDFFGPALVWSGVALTSHLAMEVPTRPADADTSTLIPIMPAAVRTFAAGDSLSLYSEAYDNDKRAPHEVELTAVVRDEAGKIVFTSREVHSSSELGGENRGYGLRTDIPLRGLAPGSYVLTLTARSGAPGNATASRDIPFAIS